MQDVKDLSVGPSGPLNAILLDDDAFDRQRLCRMVRKFDMDISVVAVSSISDMMSTLERQKFDVFLIDYRLQDATGLDALDRLQDDSFADATKIMLSGFQKTDVAVAAMQRGCADFIGKDDLTPELLELRLVRAMTRRGSTMAPAPTDIDDALRVMAQKHLPRLVIAAFEAPDVQAVLEPYLEKLIHEGVTRAMHAYDDGKALQGDGETQSLLAAMREELSLGQLTNRS